MKRLGISLDAIAVLRGHGEWPDPVHAVAMIEMAGADSVVYRVHDPLSEQELRDIKVLHECVHSHFHLRVPAVESMVRRCLEYRPEMITLIAHEQKFSSLDVAANENQISDLMELLRKNDVVASVRIDPKPDQIKSAVKIGCDYVELHTGEYASANAMPVFEQELENLKVIALTAAKFNLGVMASGNLNHHNVKAIAAIESIEEINIGHAIWSRAIFTGLDTAVKDFLSLIK